MCHFAIISCIQTTVFLYIYLKYEQVQFCDNSHCCTYCLITKNVAMIRYGLWLIRVAYYSFVACAYLEWFVKNSAGRFFCTLFAWNCQTVARSMPDVILLDLWPRDSPDFNPVDYQISATMQECVYHTDIHSVGELKRQLIQFWCSPDRDIISVAIE